MSTRSSLLLAIVAVPAALSALPGRAAIYTVGAGSSCAFSNIQAAINTADTNSGPDTIRIASNLTYAAQQLTITAVQDLEIIGGYESCTASAPTGSTSISGSGGDAAPVMRIRINQTHTVVTLRHLFIRDGDHHGGSLDGEGGGISYLGTGRLQVHDSTIAFNNADYGGGLYVRSTHPTSARVRVGNNVIFNNNIARHSGGGVFVDSAEFSMLEPGSLIYNNTAQGQDGVGGDGGGLLILSDAADPASADIGSGAPGFGSITGNTAAVQGGGVAVLAAADSTVNGFAQAQLRIHQTAAGRPATIIGNSAGFRGGGIYLRPHKGPQATVSAQAYLWNADLGGNSAISGAAIYSSSVVDPLGAPFGGEVYINSDSPLPWPVGSACTPGGFCGGIRDNTGPSSSPGSGSVVFLAADSKFIVGRRVSMPYRGGIVIEGNRGTNLIDGAGSDASIYLSNALIADNDVSYAAITSATGTDLTLIDSTVAGNDALLNHILSTAGTSVDIRRSILWQPGRTTIARAGGTLTTEHVLASEAVSLGGGSTVYAFDPRFIDPQRGDYRLRAAAGAIDVAPAVSGDDHDVNGHLRDLDLPIVANRHGPRDIGAYERQSLEPLVLHGDFDFSDLRLWTWIAGEWDGSQNAVGSGNSGSWKYSISSSATPRVALGWQCIHLPGPGRYQLTGWGKGGGNTIQNRDYAVVAWEFRRAGSEACTTGDADTGGEITLGSGTNWVSPAQPAAIEVTDAEWGSTSSLTLRLFAVDGGVTGGGAISAWFDGIRLSVSPLDDRIFANGFQP